MGFNEVLSYWAGYFGLKEKAPLSGGSFLWLIRLWLSGLLSYNAGIRSLRLYRQLRILGSVSCTVPERYPLWLGVASCCGYPVRN